MEEDDKIIREFFDKIKEVDQKRVIPGYPVKKRNRARWLLSAGVAAGIIVLLGCYFLVQQNSRQGDRRTIFLEMSVNHDPEGSIESFTAPASMDSWESPTNSLIADF